MATTVVLSILQPSYSSFRGVRVLVLLEAYVIILIVKLTGMTKLDANNDSSFNLFSAYARRASSGSQL